MSRCWTGGSTEGLSDGDRRAVEDFAAFLRGEDHPEGERAMTEDQTEKGCVARMPFTRYTCGLPEDDHVHGEHVRYTQVHPYEPPAE